MSSTVFILLFILMVFVVQLIAFKSRYIKCPPGKFLVIYGKVDNGNENGTKIIKQGSVFVWPLIQDYEFVNLDQFENRIEDKFLTKDQEEILVTGVLFYEVSAEDQLILNSSIRLIGKTKEEINGIAKDFIDNGIYHFFALRTSSEILELGNQFSEMLKAEIDETLNELGLKLKRGELKMNSSQ